MSTHTSGRISKALVERLRQVLAPACEHNTVVATMQHLSRQTTRDLFDAFEASSLAKSGARDVWRFALDRSDRSDNSIRTIAEPEREPEREPEPEPEPERDAGDDHPPSSQTTHLLGRSNVDHDNGGHHHSPHGGHHHHSPHGGNHHSKFKESTVVERTSSAQVSALVRSDVVHVEVRTQLDGSAPASVVADLDGSHVMVQLSCATPISSTSLGTDYFVVRRQFARTHTYVNSRGYEYILSISTCETHELDRRCVGDSDDACNGNGARRDTDAATPWSLCGMESALLDTRKQARELSVRYYNKADVGNSGTTHAADAPAAARDGGSAGSMLHHSINSLNLLMQCLRQDMHAALAEPQREPQRELQRELQSELQSEDMGEGMGDNSPRQARMT